MKQRVFTLLVLFIGFYMGFAQNYEGFENGNFLSNDWQFIGTENWFITYDNSYDGIYSARAGQIDDSEYSRLQVSMEVVVESEISFFWKVDSEANSDFMKFYIDNVEIESISGDLDWAFYSYNVTTGYHTFSWKYSKDDLTASGFDTGWIDNITFPQTVTYENDLAAKHIQGPSSVYQGSSNVYNVTIKNYGNAAQDNYIVKLFREGGILLDELVLNGLISSEEEIVQRLVWIVPADEPTANTHVYAEVVLTGDEDVSNNVTDTHLVNIYEIGLAQIYVGNENEETNWYPFKFHMDYSLAETIYFPIELGYPGIIHAIGYPKHFISNIVNTPIQIFIGEVGQSSLANGWISGTSLNPAFDGNIDIGSGFGTL